MGQLIQKHTDENYQEKIVNFFGAIDSKIYNNKECSEYDLNTDGLFVAVGIEPNSSVFAKELKLDDLGYIVAGENCETNIPGVFAAGDVRKKQLRQVVTAVADGANAVTSAEKYINS